MERQRLDFGCSAILIDFQIKLLSENKRLICTFGNIHYQISREKFEPEPGLEHASGMLFQEESLSVNWYLNQDSSIG